MIEANNRARVTKCFLATLLGIGIFGCEPRRDIKILDGLPVHSNLLQEDVVSRPRKESIIDTIMLHFCSDAVSSPASPYDLRSVLAVFEKYRVSPHYLITRDGTIYQLVEESRAAFHAGKGVLPWEPGRENQLNESSIGIELLAIGTETEMASMLSSEKYALVRRSDIGFTRAQYDSLNKLLPNICRRWPEISYDRRHIIGHDTYAPERRSDPGSLFDWTQIHLPKCL